MSKIHWSIRKKKSWEMSKRKSHIPKRKKNLVVLGVFCCHLAKLKQKSEKLSDFYINISVCSPTIQKGAFISLSKFTCSQICLHLFLFFFSPFSFFSLWRTLRRPKSKAHLECFVDGCHLLATSQNCERKTWGMGKGCPIYPNHVFGHMAPHKA